MSPTDAARGTTGPTAAPRRVLLSHTSDLGKPDEPDSFAAAAVGAVLRARHAVTDMAHSPAATPRQPPRASIWSRSQTSTSASLGLRHGSPVRDDGAGAGEGPGTDEAPPGEPDPRLVDDAGEATKQVGKGP